jgi:molybdate transport system regulatory protein
MLLADMVCRSRVWLERQGELLLGDQEARLLEAIERAGSIKLAAKEAGLSYRTAWARIQMMEHALGGPVVESRAGGTGGGTSRLTEESRRLVRLYADVRRRVDVETATAFDAAVTKESASSDPTSSR